MEDKEEGVSPPAGLGVASPPPPTDVGSTPPPPFSEPSVWSLKEEEDKSTGGSG